MSRIKVFNRLMTYNWQQPDWPHFRYNLQDIEATLFAFAEQTGEVKSKKAQGIGELMHLSNQKS